MFRKPPVKTYERKKGGAHWLTSSTSGITRENIPPNRELQPEKYRQFHDTDEDMDYDPFDTTFDRLVRDTKMPPLPPDEVSNSSYVDSSSDEKPSKSDSSDEDPLAIPFENPEPLQRPKIIEKRRNNKRQKLARHEMTLTSNRLTRQTNNRNKIKGISGVTDENTEPNTKVTETQSSEKKKKFSRKKTAQPKLSEVDKKTTTVIRGVKKRKDFNDPRMTKRCSVNLKRLNVSLKKSITPRSRKSNESEINHQDDIVKSGTEEKSSKSQLNADLSEVSNDLVVESIPANRKRIQSQKNQQDEIVESSEMEKTSKSQLNADVSEVSNDLLVKSVPAHRKRIQSKKNHQDEIVESSEMEKTTKSQLNADVSEVSNDLVVKSIPSNRKRIQSKKNQQDEIVESSGMEKSRLSQLNGDLSEVLNDSNVQSSIVQSSMRDEKRATKNLKNPVVSLPRLNVELLGIRDFSSSTPIVKETTKAKSSLRLSPIAIDLSEEIEDRAKDLNMSRLPKKSNVQEFEPIPSTSTASTPPRNSLKNTNENELENSSERLLRILSDSPDPDPSSLMFNDTEITMQKSTSALPHENLPNAMNTSIEGSMTGFGRESSDHESLHLTYEDDDDLPSTDISIGTAIDETVEAEIHKIPSREISNKNDVDSMINLTNDPFMGFSNTQMKNKKKARERSQKFNDDDDEWSTISGSINETRGKSLSKTEKTVELLSSRDNSLDDEISNFVNTSLSVTSRLETNDEETSQFESNESSRVESKNLTQSEKSIEERIDKAKSIELLSSREDSLNDDISEFIDASRNSPSTVETTNSGQSMQFDRDESLTLEFKDLTKSGKFIEKGREKDSMKPSLRPVVLLSRLKVPFHKTVNSESFIEINLPENASNTPDSIAELNTENETTSNFAEQPRNPVEFSEKEFEMEIRSDIEESLAEMGNLTVDKVNEKTMEGKKSTSLENRQNESSKDSPHSENYKNDSNKESSRFEKSGNKTEAPNLKKMEISEKDYSHKEFIQPVVLLTQLNDPFRITRRRKKYHNFDLQLSAISENRMARPTKAIQEDEEHESSDKATNKSETSEIKNVAKIKLSGEISQASTSTIVSQDTTVSYRSSIYSGHLNESTRGDKVVFLKPGKSWARSLSILSQVHSQDDVESLAVGKGKKWRQSVQNLLDMQQQGLIQSCVKKNEDDKERSYSGLRHSSTSAWMPGSSQSDTSKLFGATSPGRFVRRVSIRVVPDGKSFDRIKDTSFLEAYGISQTEKKTTLAERRTLIAPRQTLVYNVKDDNPGSGTSTNSLKAVKSRDVVLAQCGQNTSLPFEECYPEGYLKKCRKIGEGVYGEVFLYQNNTERSVIKIIPIEGDIKINGERQKKFDEILSEIVIAKELHNLRYADKSNTSSFVEVKNIRCVKGKYPDILIDLWNDYDEEKQSENDSPSIFEAHQLYIVLELGHAGEDLEAFVFQNAMEAHALFMQTALALAVAEDSLEFEHRDLHWGNVLISRTDNAQIDFKLQDKPICVASKGVKVSVIDFTLSRMSYQGCSIFNDLSMDEDLFVAQGEYQFDIYRLMRQKVENDWQTFQPFTNILWLHYILDKMITAVRYKRKSTKIHKAGIDKLQELKNEILEYNSAIDFVTNCDRAKRLQGSRSSVSTIESTN